MIPMMIIGPGWSFWSLPTQTYSMMIRKEKPNQILFFFKLLKWNFQKKRMRCLICFLCHPQTIKDASGQVSRTSVSCPLHSRIWSCGFVTCPRLPFGPQWFCCGVQSYSISHISKRKIIFQNYSKGRDLPFPQDLCRRFTVLLNSVYAFVAIPFLFLLELHILFFFPVPEASLLITFPSIPSKR